MVQASILTAAWLDTQDKVRWLREAADSILNQEFEDWEWIVVDDFSPLLPDLPSDTRIRSVRATNRQGPSACRNTAAALARAEALIALDADDMLAAPDVLGTLMDHWQRRPDRFYYGDIQLLQGNVPGRLVQFPQYNFVQTLNPKGLVPVTALHSKEAWYRAGGWKAELEHGLEDVEYWISVGKVGFCGFKLDMATILYRKHPTSRTAGMRADGGRLEGQMIGRIREMHADLYEGRYPVGCCGGKGGSKTSSVPLPIAQPKPRALMTDDLPGGKVWVRYNGGRTGEFNIRGQVTGTTYNIAGRSCEFQIHAQDVHFFRSLGRGKDFSVGIAAPVQEEAPPPPPVEVPAFEAPPPKAAEIVRLDPVAQQMQPAEIQMPPMVEVDSREVQEAAKDHPLESMEIPAKIKAMLEQERWTVPQLARAIPEELMPYPGIGKKLAGDIIVEAKRLWSSEP